jgi:hypothetical protein
MLRPRLRAGHTADTLTCAPANRRRSTPIALMNDRFGFRPDFFVLRAQADGIVIGQTSLFPWADLPDETPRIRAHTGGKP